MSEQAFSVERRDGTDGDAVLHLSGVFTLALGDVILRTVKKAASPDTGRFTVDLTDVESMEGGVIAILLGLRDSIRHKGGALEFQGAAPDVDRLFKIYCTGEKAAKAPPHRPGFLSQVGSHTMDLVNFTRDSLEFVGDCTASAVAAIRRPASVNWASVGQLMDRAGADGLPIVVMINFLIGLIMGIQSAMQLEKFGANIFVADLVGKTMTRELAPLMTAIIVCGRSGAAYAPELGTMKVSEEIDALQTMGLDPLRHLVFPRVIALTLMVPLLVLLGDLVGILGGLVVAVNYLDLTMVAYFTRLGSQLTLGDVFGGVLKGAVFATAITLIACQRGLATRGGAAGVGASTASAVVTTLFTLVALDMLFTMLFAQIGI